jgi:type IV pilus assembly protein PilN
MIKVNLLPEVSRKTVKKRIKPVRQIPVTWIVIGLVCVLATCVVLGVIQWAYEKKAQNLRDEIAAVDQEIKKLGIEIQKVEQFKLQKEDLEKKLGVIHQLKVAQMGPVHILDQLASAVPPRLWLQEISSSGSAITIQGSSLEHTQISTFIENLKKSPYFANVELNSDVIGGAGAKPLASSASSSVKTFQLTGTIQFPKDLN